MPSKVETDEFSIPVWDCPECGAKDQPLSKRGSWSKVGQPDIRVWSCPGCNTAVVDSKVVQFLVDSMPELVGRKVSTTDEVKEWWTLAELKVSGWIKTSWWEKLFFWRKHLSA